MKPQGFPKELRVLRKAEFDRVYRRRVSVADGVLIVYGCENGLDHPRLGLAVSRKVGNAVVRNRFKRLIREAFRLSRKELPPGIDLVATVRRGAEPDLSTIRASLVSLSPRLQRKLTRKSQDQGSRRGAKDTRA